MCSGPSDPPPVPFVRACLPSALPAPAVGVAGLPEPLRNRPFPLSPPSSFPRTSDRSYPVPPALGEIPLDKTPRKRYKGGSVGA